MPIGGSEGTYLLTPDSEPILSDLGPHQSPGGIRTVCVCVCVCVCVEGGGWEEDSLSISHVPHSPSLSLILNSNDEAERPPDLPLGDPTSNPGSVT